AERRDQVDVADDRARVDVESQSDSAARVLGVDQAETSADSLESEADVILGRGLRVLLRESGREGAAKPNRGEERNEAERSSCHREFPPWTALGSDPPPVPTRTALLVAKVTHKRLGDN